MITFEKLLTGINNIDKILSTYIHKMNSFIQNRKILF